MNPTRFESEILPNMNMLHHMALKFVHSEAEADDLVQDVMLKAYINIDSLEVGTNSRAWLCRILTNTFINKYRQKKRESSLMEKVVTEVRCHDVAFYEPATQILAKNEKNTSFAFSDEILKAFNAISGEFRSIIIMADLEELSYREIAEKLQIPMGTVMSRLSRARQMLKKYLVREERSLSYAV